MSHRRVSRRTLTSTCSAVTFALLFVWVSATADAAFPGSNGLIAFEREGSHGESTIWTVDPGNGRTRQLTPVPRRCARGRRWDWWEGQPSFSASGRLLVFEHSDACDPRTVEGIYLMRADGSERRLIRREGSRELLEFPAFSPSGRFVAFDDFLTSTLITRVRRPHRERELVVPGLRYYARQLIWSAAGRLALTLTGLEGSAETGHIGTLTAQGERLRLVTRSRRDARPDWSPTADRIVFERTKETHRGLKGMCSSHPPGATAAAIRGA